MTKSEFIRIALPSRASILCANNGLAYCVTLHIEGSQDLYSRPKFAKYN